MITRRCVCELPHYHRWIFAERCGDDVVPIRLHRTARLERIVDLPYTKLRDAVFAHLTVAEGLGSLFEGVPARLA